MASTQRAYATALAVLLLLGLVRAVDLAWVCDDSFISLRYAENLLAGEGLVYNAGERVEGYTNLLWTLLLAGAMALGAEPVTAAKGLGIAAYAGLVVTLALATRERARRDGVEFVPLAAAIVLVSDDFLQWASGGLETSLFAWLVTAGLLLTRRRAAGLGTAVAAGLVLSLVVMTRPDGVIFAAAGVASWLFPARPVTRERRLALCAVTLAPLLLVGIGLIAFKLSYYGELLPTAFHSKSVLRPYWSQGLVYVGLYLAKNWFLPVALVAAAGLRLWQRGLARPEGSDARDRDDLFFLGSATLFILYLAHVGGDFMFARRLIPAVPLVLLALEGQLLRLPTPRLRAVAAVAALAAAAIPYPVFDETRVRVHGIADERRYYPEAVIHKRRIQAEAVGRALAGLDVRVMFEGGMCVFGYYSRLPYLAEMSGLTQYSLAKLPLGERGWIGHEKQASDAWLSDNGIHFVVSHQFPPVTRPARPPLDTLWFGDLAVARIHRYDDALMEVLRRNPDVHFVPIEQVLDRRRRELDRASPEKAHDILDWLDRFYFDGAGERAEPARAELHALVAARRLGG